MTTNYVAISLQPYRRHVETARCQTRRIHAARRLATIPAASQPAVRRRRLAACGVAAGRRHNEPPLRQPARPIGCQRLEPWCLPAASPAHSANKAQYGAVEMIITRISSQKL